MNFQGNGLILFCKNFDKMVRFYKFFLKLKPIFEQENLVNLKINRNFYLMLEPENFNPQRKENSNNRRSIFRFDVELQDLMKIKQNFYEKKVKFIYAEENWGYTIKFCDPDKNLCEIYAPCANMPDNFTQR